ncbi:MAG: KpsF/GutQ family sugar-phosphate isomerase [Candidatus Eisenbacteria bacterium]|nr:KpsF/GutQ family sugar-phosphate isomerase [Candidatus Latescibacterota bacterium]MBD3302584.1 KpsF/GutQ family sugar-phosphate isomerase [Candidatus Eisenbacteria bacterium]
MPADRAAPGGRGTRARGEREEGAVPGPGGHGAGSGEAPGGPFGRGVLDDGARHELRLPRSRRRHARDRDDAPLQRDGGLRRDPFSPASRRGRRAPVRPPARPRGARRGGRRPVPRDPSRSGPRAQRPEDPAPARGGPRSPRGDAGLEAAGGGAGDAGEDVTRLARRAREILSAQVDGVRRLDAICGQPEFEQAVEWIVGCRGRVLISGVGKSGIVASKLAASLRSTGTPAVYLHPVEAMHGDLGLVGPEDLGVFLSKSGESRELLELVPTCKKLGVPIIAIVTRAASTLGGLSDLVLDVGPIREAGVIETVPTTSTTVFQVLGDILTLLVLEEKGITQEHFALLHPGGVLGQVTTLRVRDVMRTGERLPRVREGASLQETLVEMIDKRLGMTTVVDRAGKLIGIVTDGDLRRSLHRFGSTDGLKVLQVMSRSPKTIEGDQLLASAVHRMETNPEGPITSLIVVDPDGKPDGVIHLHDCLRLGMGSTTHLA